MNGDDSLLVPSERAFEQSLPFCIEVDKYIASGKSAIFHMCQRSGQTSLYRHIQNVTSKDVGCDVCVIALSEYTISNEVNYIEIARSIQRSADVPRDEQIDNRWKFRSFLLDLDSNLSQPLVIVISVSGPDFSKHAFELICDFHKSMSEMILSTSLLRLIVVDDYSLYFYERWRTAQNSRWDIFFREFYTGFSKKEHRDYFLDCISHSNDISIWNSIVDELYTMTGGHYGITLDVLSYIEHRRWTSFPDDWAQQVRIEISKGDVVEFLKAALEEDGQKISKRALQFIEPNTIDASDTRVDQFIRRVGLLKAEGEFTFQLDQGILGQLLILYSETSKKVGPVLNFNSCGLNSLEEVPSLEDDDFVIVHLSDIHFGEDFPFNITEADEKEFPDRLNLVDAIVSDLDGLELLERIDGIVVSGDLTNIASMPEFLRARVFIDTLLDKLNVTSDSLSIIGGNHDVEWFSEENEVRTYSEDPPASKANLGVFMELLSGNGATDARLTSIRSRSAARELMIIAVDSNFVESRDAGGIGFVSKDTLAKATNLVDAGLSELDEKINSTVWCVTHHHVFPVLDAPVEDARRGKVTTMASAATLLDGCSQMSVEVILHGHEHQPTITKSTRWHCSNERSFRPISVVGAGSIGAPPVKLGPFSRNHYYVIHSKRESLIVMSRMLGDTKMGFTSHANLRA